MSEGSIFVSYDGRIATITLNRPEVLNALDKEMIENFGYCLQEVKENACEVVIIRGAGRGFCAGGDMKSLLSQQNNDQFFEVMEAIKEMVITLYTLPKIVICSIHGAAAGLGLSIALASDCIFAETSAIIAMNFIGIGLIPDGGGHFFLKKRVGDIKAKQIIWEGQKLTAPKALELGIIDEVAENVQERAAEKAEEILQKPTKAMIETKEIINSTNYASLQTVLKLEAKGQFKMRQTIDHQEGVRAFLEKRVPTFKGE